MKENTSTTTGHESAHPESEYLTKIEVAQLFQLSTRTIDSWIAQGRLPYYRIGRTIRFRRSDIREYLDRHYRVGRFD